MFGSQILDTAIGIVFIFVLISTLVTIGNELIASILTSRAAWLSVGIERLLGPELATALYAHPLLGGAQPAPAASGSRSVSSAAGSSASANAKPSASAMRRTLLSRLGRFVNIAAREGSAKPSYIASRTFANVLLDLVHQRSDRLRNARAALEQLCGVAAPGASIGADAATVKADPSATDFAGFSAMAQSTAVALDAANCPTIAATLRRLLLQMPPSTTLEDARTAVLRLSDALAVHGLQDVLDDLPDRRVGNVLRVLLRDAEGDIDTFKENVEVWFNNAMDRVAGWYKRRSQWVVFALGVVIAVVMNIDSLAIIHFLQTSPGARESLVAQAKAYAAVKDATPTDPAVLVINAGDTYTASLRLNTPPANGGKVNLTSDSPAVTFVSKQVVLKNGQQDVAVEVRTPPSGPAIDATITGTTQDNGSDGKPASGTLRLHINAGFPQQFETLQSRLLELDLPIAWVRSANAKKSDSLAFNVIPDSSNVLDTFLFHALGWLVTALAATLGAPFWFDVLNRIVAIRSSGKAPEEKPKPPKQVQLPLEPGESPQEAERANAGRP